MPRILYSAQEYANMHFIYGECKGNANEAATLYRERYPNARHPDYLVFIRVHSCFSEGRLPGSGVGGAGVGRPPRGDTEDLVLAELDRDPTVSIRAIARRTGIGKTTAHNVLSKYKYHPFHLTRVQTLQPQDFETRMSFCRQMIMKIEEDPQFFDKILWSDESTFKRDGYTNLHNLHFWALQNPNIMREDRSQYQFKINYWTGILNGKIIGPFELPGILTGQGYLEFLQNDLPTLLEEVPQELKESHWLQNDGCPAHYAVPVRAYLNARYPGRWIGRLGPILWPPRSPDLNPLDFFYWGCIKEIVYSKPIRSLEELRNRVEAAALQISEQNLARSLRRSFIRRCRTCIRVGGKQFEHLL